MRGDEDISGEESCEEIGCETRGQSAPDGSILEGIALFLGVMLLLTCSLACIGAWIEGQIDKIRIRHQRNPMNARRGPPREARTSEDPHHLDPISTPVPPEAETALERPSCATDREPQRARKAGAERKRKPTGHPLSERRLRRRISPRRKLALAESTYWDQVWEIIEELKALPPDYFDEMEPPLENLWEEFKAQVQIRERLSFDLFEDLVKDKCRERTDRFTYPLIWILSRAFDPEIWENESLPDMYEQKDSLAEVLYSEVHIVADKEELDLLNPQRFACAAAPGETPASAEGAPEPRLDRLGKMALKHWRKRRPKMYRALLGNGQLLNAAFKAQELTHEYRAEAARSLYREELLRSGFETGRYRNVNRAAWKLVRENWIFLPGEREQPELGSDPGTWELLETDEG